MPSQQAGIGELGGDPALRIAREGLGYHPRHLEPILKGKTPPNPPGRKVFFSCSRGGV